MFRSIAYFQIHVIIFSNKEEGEKTWDEKASIDGKTRFIGTSTHKNEPDVIRATVDAGIYDVVLTAQSVVLNRKEDIKKAIAYAASIQNPLYCQNCRSCISSCPKEVEIPSLMRAYMYAEGYGNLLQAERAAEVLPHANTG